MNNFAKRLEKLEKNKTQIPLFVIHFKDGSSIRKTPADCIPLFTMPESDEITHLTSEGDLHGYGELFGLLNALLADDENTPEIAL